MMVSASITRERGDTLPDFFGDERHDRMCQTQHGFQNLQQGLAGAALQGCIIGLQGYFRQLQIPVTVFIPGEFVNRLRCQVKTVLSIASVVASITWFNRAKIHDRPGCIHKAHRINRYPALRCSSTRNAPHSRACCRNCDNLRCGQGQSEYRGR